MDPFNMLYYAAVCGALALGGPRLRTPRVRLAAGAIVGLLAAALLPMLRRWIGLA